MKQYASKIILEINGKKFEDFSAFTEGKIPLAKEVPLMGGSGYSSVTARYGFSLDYTMPAKKAERLDFTQVKNAVVTIVYEDGSRTIFTGSTPLEIGEGKHDGENPVSKTIPFIASGRREE